MVRRLYCSLQTRSLTFYTLFKFLPVPPSTLLCIPKHAQLPLVLLNTGSYLQPRINLQLIPVSKKKKNQISPMVSPWEHQSHLKAGLMLRVVHQHSMDSGGIFMYFFLVFLVSFYFCCFLNIELIGWRGREVLGGIWGG